MAYGGSSATRGWDLGKLAAKLFERVGLLNPGSSETPAAPDPATGGAPGVISSNSLNVTRVGGITALIAGAGAAALALFGVDKVTDAVAIVAVAYAATGLIVAATLIAVAVIVASDIRARADLAKAASTPAQAHVAVRTVEGGETTAVTLGTDDDFVVVDAHAGDVEMRLPDPAKFGNRILTLRRTDMSLAHAVAVRDSNGFGPEYLMPGRRELRVYTANNEWHLLT